MRITRAGTGDTFVQLLIFSPEDAPLAEGRGLQVKLAHVPVTLSATELDGLGNRDIAELLKGHSCLLRIWEVSGPLSGFKKDILNALTAFGSRSLRQTRPTTPAIRLPTRERATLRNLPSSHRSRCPSRRSTPAHFTCSRPPSNRAFWRILTRLSPCANESFATGTSEGVRHHRGLIAELAAMPPAPGRLRREEMQYKSGAIKMTPKEWLLRQPRAVEQGQSIDRAAGSRPRARRPDHPPLPTPDKPADAPQSS